MKVAQNFLSVSGQRICPRAWVWPCNMVRVAPIEYTFKSGDFRMPLT